MIWIEFFIWTWRNLNNEQQNTKGVLIIISIVTIFPSLCAGSYYRLRFLFLSFFFSFSVALVIVSIPIFHILYLQFFNCISFLLYSFLLFHILLSYILIFYLIFFWFFIICFHNSFSFHKIFIHTLFSYYLSVVLSLFSRLFDPYTILTVPVNIRVFSYVVYKSISIK